MRTLLLDVSRSARGGAFDLPTEAQWEYACRAGTTGNYNNGNSLDLLARFYAIRSDTRGGYTEHTQVGSYLSNTWGLYDMHGEVLEWCLDWYGGIDTQAPANDPVGAASGSRRVQRGGSCDGNNYQAASGYRVCNSDSSYGYFSFGFRLVRSLE